MTPRRLFACMLAATLVLDVVGVVVLRVPLYSPGVLGLGRWAICLVAGYAGSRYGTTLLGMMATFAGAMVATVLTVAAYVVSGAATADLYGPAAVYALVLATAAIAVVGSAVGSVAGLLLRKRFRPA